MTSANRTHNDEDLASQELDEFVTFFIEDQMFGVPILKVQDILAEQNITRIPLSQSTVAGSLNLRGHIVTALDVRTFLDVPKASESNDNRTSIVVDHKGELYSLLVDHVGDVLKVKKDTFEENPATLNPRWRAASSGIYRLKDKLLVALSVDKLLDLCSKQE